jgi:NADPH-dependent 2,4-dienoyl-CoA reductase/sulfur reductase-like enzyme
VDLRCGVGVDAFEGAGRIERVRLSDGTSVDADLVVIGIGAVPATDWLESSGLELKDGVVCDAKCATRAPDVVAAGDVARWPHPLYGEPIRIEHWTNAVEQGMYAATRLLKGADAVEPYAAVPLFWSDQYNVKIQFAGRMTAEDENEVVWGSLEDRKFTVLYGRAGKLTGVLTFGHPRDCMFYCMKIKDGISYEDALAEARQRR